MEVPGGHANKPWVLVSELLGSAMLAAAVNWGGTSSGTPHCAGLTIFIMAQVFGPISGGHFNPAITLSMMIKHRHVTCGPAVLYGILIIFAQIIGCMIGCGICLMGFPLGAQSGNALPSPGGHYLTQLCPANGCNDGGALMGQTFLVEFMMTFLFVTFYLQIAKENGAKDVPINALAIGVALYCCLQVSGGISGGCLNPAIGIVQPVFQKMMNGRIYPAAPKTQLTYMAAYINAPMLGGIFAGLFQRYYNEYAITKAKEAKGQEIELAGLN